MSEKEFDIIIKHKLADGAFVPTNAGWESVQKAIANTPQVLTSVASAKKPFTIYKKMAWAAALLLPICGIAFLLNQNSGTKAISKETKPSLNNTNNNANITNNSNTNETKIYKTPIINSDKISTPNNNNYVANVATNANSTKTAVAKTATTFTNNNNSNDNFNTKNAITNNVNNTNSDNFSSPNTIISNNVNNTITNNNTNNQNNVVQKTNTTIQQNSFANSNKNDNKNKSNTKLFANNSVNNYPAPSNTSNKNYDSKNPLGISLTAGYGASKGSAAIKQAGILVQQKISRRFYADASVQISSQGGGVINNNVLARRALYSQDVNVLSGNTQAITSENANMQKQIAVNRIPITQLLCNPSIGYRLNDKSYVAFGAEVARNIDNNNSIRLNEDLNTTAPAVVTTKSKLGDWDGGITGKVGYNISRRLCAEAKYRQGVVNVVDNLNGNTKRSYGIIGLNYRLR